MTPQILLIDDDRIFSALLERRLSHLGWELKSAGTANLGMEELKKANIDIILLDVYLPDRSGVDLVAEIKNLLPDVPIVMVSTSGTTANIVAAIKNGASDYVTKPVDENLLIAKIDHLLEIARLKKTHQELFKAAASQDSPRLIGQSPAIRQLLREVGKIAGSDSTILLFGETGTGKNLVAEMIHSLSRRRDHRFTAINCGAIPSNLLESELFGHERGAFTGAVREKRGLFEVTDRGTVFLDEIGELAMEMQVKLLRVLQGQEFERVGGVKTIKVDVRVIAATNRNLEKAIADGSFREDLFYRLNVLPVSVPPLRERKEDIGLLVDHFVSQYGQKTGKTFKKASPEIIAALSEYSWPGNVRELQNVVERAVVLAREPELLPSDFSLKTSNASQTGNAPETADNVSSLKEIEQKLLLQALHQAGGNVSKAARSLGISRGTIYRRLERYDIGLKR